MLVSYGLLSVFLWYGCRNAGVGLRIPSDAWPPRNELWAYILLGIPLIAIAILGFYILYLPLSYVFPDSVVWWALDTPPFYRWSGTPEILLASGINAITSVLIGPVVEEFFFRGFLLNRWRRKYGVEFAVIFSSIIFAVLHVEFIGGIVFGAVLALIYIKTGSLIGPIIAHISNNAIDLLWTIFDDVVYGELSSPTLDEFRSDWWVALLGAAVGVPWLLWFCKKLLGREPPTP